MRRLALAGVLLAIAGGAAGCGNSQEAARKKRIEQEVHNIYCGPENGEAKLIGGQRQRECEHPAEVQAEWKEYQREHPAAAKAQEEEKTKEEAAG